jgi:hypothetical protein
VDAEYRRGYVSMSEVPGKDYKPGQTTEVNYMRDEGKPKRVMLIQTFMNNKGHGTTTFKPDDYEEKAVSAGR